MKSKGFTLIELMIVVAIIAIIAAISVPNLITGRISANETSAIASLRILMTQNMLWRQRDEDGNGLKDYWTYDISCFHRMYRGDGSTQNKLSLVDMALGRSDFTPATDDVFGAMPAFEDWNGVSPVSKSGYYIRVILQDVNGNNYSQNPVGTNNILATNNNFFGIMSAPAEYGSSGIRSAIVNQEGIIYQVDCGGDANKWGTTAIFTLRWPGVVPSRIQAPSGYYWGVSGD